MANRKVSVYLELEVAGYNKGAGDALAVTKVLKVEIKELGDEADATSRDMDQLAANTDLAANRVDELGDEARGTVRNLAELQAQVAATKLAVRGLALEFARTNDPAVGTAYDAKRAELAKLERLLKDASPDLPHTAAGFSGGLRGPLIGALVGAAVAASPVIGAAIAGAVTGAVGVAGIAGGIAAAAQDPKVRTAATKFAADMGVLFHAVGVPFVQPTIDALHEIELAVEDMHLDDALAKVAPLVTVLAKGFGDFGRNLMPGLNTALDHAGPAIGVLADGIGDMGKALGDMIRDMSESDGAIEGLDILFRVINGTIHVVGDSIEGLGDAFDFMARHGAAVTGDLEDVFKWGTLVSPVFGLLAGKAAEFNNNLEDLSREGLATVADWLEKHGIDAVSRFAHAQDIAGRAIDDANSALTAQKKLLFDNTDATIAAEQAIDDLAESFHKNGKTLDAGKQKGRDNLRALEEVGRTEQKLMQQAVEHGASQKELNDIYKHYRDELYKTARQAGLTKKQAQELVDTWLSLPPKIVTQVDFNVGIHVTGRGQLSRVLDELDRFGGMGISRWGSLAVHADTGMLRDAKVYPAGSSPLYAFAEPATGGEAFIPRFGDYARSMAILNQAASWHGARVVPAGAGGGAGIDYAQLGAAVAQAMQSAPLQGVVSMDGRAVGRLQGREANLLTRGF